jgi:hypothetical protein
VQDIIEQMLSSDELDEFTSDGDCTYEAAHDAANGIITKEFVEQYIDKCHASVRWEHETGGQNLCR